MHRSSIAPVALIAAMMLSACHHQKPAPEAPAPAPAPPPAPAPAPAPAPSNSDSAANANAARERAMAAARNTIEARIYFDFDKSDLRDDAKSALDAKLPILRANPNMRIRIEGNCDERGSEEYNMALGQRRAAAAKRYLTNYGIDASRIDVISYGSERPVAQGHDESSWSQNRRDEFVITAGGESITVTE